MSDDEKDDPSAYALDSAWIRELAAILSETGLTEIEIERGDVKLRVTRQLAPVLAQMPSGPAAAPAPAPQAIESHDSHAPDPGAPGPRDAAKPGDHPGAVKSPMVGTAYRSPSPGAKPFVDVGDKVKEGQTLLIVEAMKTMNPIAAPHDGTVSSIFVSDAQPVEFEETLLIIS